MTRNLGSPGGDVTPSIPFARSHTASARKSLFLTFSAKNPADVIPMCTFNLPPFSSRLEPRCGEGHSDLGSMEGRVQLKDTEHRKSDVEGMEKGNASGQMQSWGDGVFF